MNLRLLEEHISRSEEKLNPLPLETIVVEKNALKKQQHLLQVGSSKVFCLLLIARRTRQQETN